MDWIESSIDNQMSFNCPVCGKSLIPKMVICEHVEFYFSDFPDDSSQCHYATDAFSSFLFLELLVDDKMGDEFLEDFSEDAIKRARAGLLGYQELPGIMPTMESLDNYFKVNPDLTVYEFKAAQYTYGGTILIALNNAESQNT